MTPSSGGRINLFINSVQPPEGSSSDETNISDAADEGFKVIEIADKYHISTSDSESLIQRITFLSNKFNC
jgi:hypothetical protein